ncbi:MAG TPA: hypothetical protein VFV89_14435 [Nocardioides sp.]|uniref:hypothetical protein n=1 Tax=Nocardioides sp. TaxID=35761 RepID=UPI002E30B997|nr:hypothetical protein [Nocardioides sp.]HEX5089001.1 hypothetical protein [Nocardioides sp.]
MHAVVVQDDLTTTSAVAHECVAVLDETTTLSGRALTRAVALLDHEPTVGTVFVSPGEGRRDAVESGHRWLRQAAAHGPDTIGSRWTVMRRTTFEAASQQGLGTRSGELSLWLRAAALADVAHVAEPLPVGSFRAASRLTARVGELTELHERAHAFRDLFGSFAPLRDQARLRSSAYRALARSARSRARVAAHEGDPVEASLCRHLARDIDRWRRRG